MNRRNFVGTLLGGAALAAVPWPIKALKSALAAPQVEIPFEIPLMTLPPIPAVIGEWNDYTKFSSFVASSIDENTAIEMSYRLGKSISDFYVQS